jgi:hypothetical protein
VARSHLKRFLGRMLGHDDGLYVATELCDREGDHAEDRSPIFLGPRGSVLFLLLRGVSRRWGSLSAPVQN